MAWAFSMLLLQYFFPPGFLDIFPWALLEMGPCAVVGHIWKCYIITWFFVHFPMGLSWNGSECKFVGRVLKITKINKWVCEVGLIEQSLANQPFQCNKCPNAHKETSYCIWKALYIHNLPSFKSLTQRLYSLRLKSFQVSNFENVPIDLQLYPTQSTN